MIAHVRIMPILRVRISLPPIIGVLHIMVRRRLAQEKNVRFTAGMRFSYISTRLTFFIVILLD